VRIHVTGASGSGTTTLGAALAAALGCRHLDADDFYWLPTDPPYREPRPRPERQAMLRRAVDAAPAWVLSGSMCDWGDLLIPEIELAVFLLVPAVVRLTRLRARELERYGHAALAPGGAMHEAHAAFLDWAGRYDEGGLEMRSRQLHEAWLSGLACRVVRLEGDRPMADLLAELEELGAAEGLTR